MKEDLKDILSNLNSEVDQETLLRYLQGKLSAPQQHDVEKNLLQNDFETEALEGLQHFADKGNIAALVERLNTDLKKKTAKNKSKRRRLPIKVEPWLLIAVVLILVLAILGYFIIYQMRR